MSDKARALLRRNWLRQQLGEGVGIRPLAGDASFRRYFRIASSEGGFVLMDAPPPHEDVRPFLAVRDWFAGAGLRVSALQAADIEQGLLLLEDFGDLSWATYQAAGRDLEPLFEDALRQLSLLQHSTPPIELPLFDQVRMHRECDLYLDWYLPRVAGMTPTDDERGAFHAALAAMIESIAALPRVSVHLDYHSRNLMLPGGGLPLGQIDYQDAVQGPVTYDLASLLYDCYQDYPETERRRWSRHFFEMLPAQIAEAFADFDDWHRAVRLTALQRHIKAIGIFARLAYRDGKRQFLDEMPLTAGHIRDEMQALAMDRTEFPLLAMALPDA